MIERRGAFACALKVSSGGRGRKGVLLCLQFGVERPLLGPSSSRAPSIEDSVSRQHVSTGGDRVYYVKPYFVGHAVLA